MSTFVGHAFSWFIVGLTLHGHLGGVLALRARRPARLGVRRDGDALRHAVHDGRRLHAVEERPRARRRALRLLPAAHPGDASTSSSTSSSSSPACSRSPMPATTTPPIVGDQRALQRDRRRAADLSRSRRSSRSPARSCSRRASSRSCAASSASGRAYWPSREEDVEEVDVDKLKEMVHVEGRGHRAGSTARRRRGGAQ